METADYGYQVADDGGTRSYTVKGKYHEQDAGYFFSAAIATIGLLAAAYFGGNDDPNMALAAISAVIAAPFWIKMFTHQNKITTFNFSVGDGVLTVAEKKYPLKDVHEMQVTNKFIQQGRSNLANLFSDNSATSRAGDVVGQMVSNQKAKRAYVLSVSFGRKTIMLAGGLTEDVVGPLSADFGRHAGFKPIS